MKSLLTMALSVGLGLSCSAATITFGTGVPGTTEGNGFNGVNVPTIPDPVWHSPLGTSTWESIQTNSMNPPIPNGTLVDFYFQFNIPTDVDISSASLGVLVDDSAIGTLNGNVIFHNLHSPQGNNCAASLPNCLIPLTVDIQQLLIIGGVNRLDVFVGQDGNGPFGLDVFGQVSDSAIDPHQTTTPEPLTLSMIGIGLVTIGFARRRRRTD